jgi:hypothetical protein
MDGEKKIRWMRKRRKNGWGEEDRVSIDEDCEKEKEKNLR